MKSDARDYFLTKSQFSELNDSTLQNSFADPNVVVPISRVPRNATNVAQTSLRADVQQVSANVEYLEDSRISIDYFRMKNSVYFSMIAKDDPAITQNQKKQSVSSMYSSINIRNSQAQAIKDEKVKFFNISNLNGDNPMLSSFIVLLKITAA